MALSRCALTSSKAALTSGSWPSSSGRLSRAWANCFPGYASIADPLIALNDYGMKASGVRDTFAALRARLVPLMRAIASA